MRLVEIVCTDRGQHGDRGVRLELLADARAEGGGITYAVVSPAPSRPLTRVSKLLQRDPDFLRRSGSDFRFHCPKCGRRPRMSERNLGRAIDTLARGDDTCRIDVSLLP